VQPLFSGKAINITQPECASVPQIIYDICTYAFSMQCACAILSSVAYPALQHFSTLSLKQHNFRKKLLDTNCVCWFSIQGLSGTFLIL